MMWPIYCLMIQTFNLSEMKMMNKLMTVSPEILNIVMMTLATLTLNEMMLMKESSKKEEKNKTIIKMISLMVMTSFMTTSPLVFLILMESTIYPLGYMILNTSKDKDKVDSLKFMILMNTAGSIPFMIYTGMKMKTEFMTYMAVNWQTNIMLITMLILFMVKTPIMFFHVWLTKAHVSASGNCSMILASIMIKMGTMGIYKFMTETSIFKEKYFFFAIALMGSMYFSMMMIRFFDAKTLIAMSSILHMSMILPLVMTKKSNFMMPSLMMMTSHGLISYFLFYLITKMYEKTENRTIIFMKSTESLSKSLALMIVMMMFMNLGIPPFMNFCAETMFMVNMNIMKSNLSTMLLAMSLLISILFTMQMNTNILYSKSEMASKKKVSEMSYLKFTFFMMWAFMIMWSM